MKNQSGVALVVSLILLVVALLLGISGFQVSRLEESMTGNQRSMELAHMAAESGVSAFYTSSSGLGGGWPSSSAQADPWYGAGHGESVSAYAYYELEGICWGGEVASGNPGDCSEDFDVGHVTLWMNGFSGGGSAVSRVVARFRQLPLPPKSAAFTCFGEDCSDEVGGSAALTGVDHHIPNDFNCQGSACDAEENLSGEDQVDAYYPDVPEAAHPGAEECTESYHAPTSDEPYTECDGAYYGVNDSYDIKEYWENFLSLIESSGYDKSVMGGDSFDEGEDSGGRGDYSPGDDLDSSGFWDTLRPKFVEVLPNPDDSSATVKINANVNTFGVIVVKSGAVLEYQGTSSHEGLIIVEPGGKLDASTGNPNIYGGIVALESLDGVTAELDISGNVDVRYSSVAWAALVQSGKGARLVSWYEDVSQ